MSPTNLTNHNIYREASTEFISGELCPRILFNFLTKRDYTYAVTIYLFISDIFRENFAPCINVQTYNNTYVFK